MIAELGMRKAIWAREERGKSSNSDKSGNHASLKIRQSRTSGEAGNCGHG
ncbi:hypothetical protein J6TS7_27370 [Paenibacillus dendritiformis]|nr:hypothetical protein J6TS7_27370 [Paenibacillus dendritiformis]